MAEVFRGERQRSAELAGDLHVARPATCRLLHPRLFGALRRGARANDRLDRGLQCPLQPFEDARGWRLHAGRGTEAAMDRGVRSEPDSMRLRRSPEGGGDVARIGSDLLQGRAGRFLIRRHLSSLSPCWQNAAKLIALTYEEGLYSPPSQ